MVVCQNYRICAGASDPKQRLSLTKRKLHKNKITITLLSILQNLIGVSITLDCSFSRQRRVAANSVLLYYDLPQFRHRLMRINQSIQQTDSSFKCLINNKRFTVLFNICLNISFGILHYSVKQFIDESMSDLSLV